MEQPESGSGSLCLSSSSPSPLLFPFPIPVVVSSLCLQPPTDHRCTTPVPDATPFTPPSASPPRPTDPSKWNFGGGSVEVDRVTRVHEYITNGNRGKKRFFFHEKKFPAPAL